MPDSRAPPDWFLIGHSASVMPDAAGHLHASVDAAFHDNDTDAFDVDMSAVPEPAPLALMVAASWCSRQRHRHG